MCKYCKRLKELMDLNEKEYLKIIRAWQLRDEKARRLVSELYRMLLYDGADVIFIRKGVEDFLNSNWIGK